MEMQEESRAHDVDEMALHLLSLRDKLNDMQSEAKQKDEANAENEEETMREMHQVRLPPSLCVLMCVAWICGRIRIELSITHEGSHAGALVAARAPDAPDHRACCLRVHYIEPDGRSRGSECEYQHAAGRECTALV